MKAASEMSPACVTTLISVSERACSESAVLCSDAGLISVRRRRVHPLLTKARAIPDPMPTCQLDAIIEPKLIDVPVPPAPVIKAIPGSILLWFRGGFLF